MNLGATLIKQEYIKNEELIAKSFENAINLNDIDMLELINLIIKGEDI